MDKNQNTDLKKFSRTQYKQTYTKARLREMGRLSKSKKSNQSSEGKHRKKNGGKSTQKEKRRNLRSGETPTIQDKWNVHTLIHYHQTVEHKRKKS